MGSSPSSAMWLRHCKRCGRRGYEGRGFCRCCSPGSSGLRSPAPPVQPPPRQVVEQRLQSQIAALEQRLESHRAQSQIGGPSPAENEQGEVEANDQEHAEAEAEAEAEYPAEWLDPEIVDHPQAPSDLQAGEGEEDEFDMSSALFYRVRKQNKGVMRDLRSWTMRAGSAASTRFAEWDSGRRLGQCGWQDLMPRMAEWREAMPAPLRERVWQRILHERRNATENEPEAPHMFSRFVF